jgi:hypothetical protein
MIHNRITMDSSRAITFLVMEKVVHFAAVVGNQLFLDAALEVITVRASTRTFRFPYRQRLLLYGSDDRKQKKRKRSDLE